MGKRGVIVVRRDLFKGVVLGAVVSTVVLMAATAMAGTGIGAIFNLGKTNTVNAASTLKGATSASGRNLQLTNTGAGSGLGITVGAGKAPIKVNAAAGTAANLSADRLDGKHANQLLRAAVASTGATTAIPAAPAFVTYGPALSITAPAAGFVVINANVSLQNVGCTAGCEAYLRVRHINSGDLSLYSNGGLFGQPYTTVGSSYVFPVSAGVNTFDLRLQRATGNGTLNGWWGQMNAIYVPFGHTGTGTLRPVVRASTPVAADKGI